VTDDARNNQMKNCTSNTKISTASQDCIVCSERKIKRADHETVYCGVPRPVKQELQKWQLTSNIYKNGVMNMVTVKYF
jgi:hypothetical protein